MKQDDKTQDADVLGFFLESTFSDDIIVDEMLELTMAPTKTTMLVA